VESLHQITQKLETLTALLEALQLHQQKAMLNPEEAATYMGISKSTLYKHTSGGNIAYYKPNGKLILFRKADLDKWLETNRIPSNAELLLDI
jgi:excisionase family DNA binding protein